MATPRTTTTTATDRQPEESYHTTRGHELIAASELMRQAHRLFAAVKDTQMLIADLRIAHRPLREQLRRALVNAHASRADMNSLADFDRLVHDAEGFAWACQMFASFIDGILIPLPDSDADSNK